MYASCAKQVIYKGEEMQSHGIRYAISHEAQSHDVTGYTQNLPDGSIEIKVMGYDQDVDGFLQALRECEFAETIETEEINDIKPMRGISGFRVQ